MKEKLLDAADDEVREHEHHHHEHGEACNCEHGHHHHEHSESCNCEHDYEHHHHEHGEACGCGHDREHKHHHHEHGEACGCGHDHEYEHHHHEHGEACGCGHDHEHEHHHQEHGEACGCGHDHEHQQQDHHHEHGETCGCGHDHKHEHHHHEHGEACNYGHDHKHEEAEHHHEVPPTDKPKRVYIMENLGCAHCASKMEERINELPGVEYATITYATKQLRIAADDPDTLLPQIQEICTAIESEVKVIPREPVSGGHTAVFLLENLGCAHCASKMEDRINELPGVAEATITFATKQLRVRGRNLEDLLPELQRICASIESEVQVIPRSTSQPAASEKAPEKSGKLSENVREGIEIAIGAVLFAAGLILGEGTASIVCFLAGYLILGGKIILTALKNLFRGQLTDENFLMSLATIAAIAIKDYPEACGVMLFYRVGELFEHIAVERSRSQIMAAVDLRPEVVSLIDGENVLEIPAQEAMVGDLVQVRPGDRIPLDGVIIDGESRIDTSPVTGEPVPVSVHAGDAVISGCVNTSGLLKMRVEKPLSESMVTRILDSVENAAASKPKIDRFITRFAHIYTPVVVLLALATAILPSLITGNWNYWIYTAITFLVISCPCALVLSVPLAFFSGIGAGSKRGILFKGGVALEVMKDVKAVVMDKTGTITEGNFVVQSCVPANGGDEMHLLALAAGCEAGSTHPIAHSIVSAAEARGIAPLHPQSVREISGWGIEAVFSEGKALCGGRKLLEREKIDLSSYKGSSYGTEVLLALDGKFAGQLVISDTVKQEAGNAISAMKALGLTTAMLTGDAKVSADAVAAETGVQLVRASLLPEEKLSALQQIRAECGPVMFVGDGINDAPVLAGADVGAAMGSGADAAIEAADVVFMTSSVDAIPQALEIARVTGRIAWQNVVFALFVKAMVMVLGFAGIANMWMAVFADTGVAMLCVLNSVRVLYRQYHGSAGAGETVSRTAGAAVS